MNETYATALGFSEPSRTRTTQKAIAGSASVMGGVLIGTQSLIGFGSILAVPVAVFFLARPVYGLIGIFFVVNVLFVVDRMQRIGFTLPVTGGTISATDLLYGLLTACVIWKWTMDKDIYYPSNKLGTPLFLLLAWAGICLFMGIAGGGEVKKSMIEWRPLLYLSIFYLTVFLVRDEATLMLVLKGFLFSYLATFALGFSIFVQGRKAIEYFTMGQIDPGQSILPRFTFVSSDFVLTLLFMAIGLIIFLRDQRYKIFLVILSSVLVLNLLLIQARTQILGLFIGMAPIIILAPGLKRIKIMAAGFAGIMFLAVAIFAIAQTESGQKKIIDPILERFSGIYKKQTDVDQSLERRRMESDAIWPGIVKRPLIGNGFGSKWTTDPKWVTVYKHDPTYIHSSWLYFLFKTGLIGTMLMLFLFYRAAMLALSIVRNPSNPFFRGISLGILATMPTFVFSGLLQPTLWHFQMTPIIGFEFAVVVIMADILERDASENSVVPYEA